MSFIYFQLNCWYVFWYYTSMLVSEPLLPKWFGLVLKLGAAFLIAARIIMLERGGRGLDNQNFGGCLQSIPVSRKGEPKELKVAMKIELYWLEHPSCVLIFIQEYPGKKVWQFDAAPIWRVDCILTGLPWPHPINCIIR